MVAETIFNDANIMFQIPIFYLFVVINYSSIGGPSILSCIYIYLLSDKFNCINHDCIYIVNTVLGFYRKRT